jgi:hypothetical protein
MAEAKRLRVGIVVPLVLLGFAALYAWQAMRLPVRNIPGSVGISFVPLLLAGLLAVLALVLLGQGLRAADMPPPGNIPPWGQAGCVVGVMGAYVALLVTVGFLVASPLFLAVAMLRCGERRAWYILAVALGITGAVWLVFWSLFGVPLPRGPLG